MFRELAYDHVISRVRGVQFCVLGPDEIRRRSAVEVTTNQTYVSNEPVAGGLFDVAMGATEWGRSCPTCGNGVAFCDGHFGHLEMAVPVFHIQFMEVVRKTLRCVCVSCSRVLVDDKAPEFVAIASRKLTNQRRWEAMHKLCVKARRCGHCGAAQPDAITRTDDMRLRLVWKPSAASARREAIAPVADDDEDEPEEEEFEEDEEPERDDDDDADERAASTPTTQAMSGGGGGSSGADVVFGAADALRVLRRIRDADARALGIDPDHCRPDWLVCTVLPVPPPSVRPSARTDASSRQEDDLTHILSDIVKYNGLVRAAIERGSATKTVDALVSILQAHVAMLVDNGARGGANPPKDRGGRVLRSLSDRIKHKDGRIRGNLLGKRVDFSARTVITPDPNLSVDELGVPAKIAMELTFPEVVSRHNRDRLKALVLTGPHQWPGARMVRKAGQAIVRLADHPDRGAIELNDGDVVERHLADGDHVMFNRQPSLHKLSMMAHRVRVMGDQTFRLNVCVCACYNADFDGDEMNMHVPQSLQTHHEIKSLAAVPRHILSPRYSKPIITIVQDVALGVFRITQPGVRVPRAAFWNLVASNPALDPAALPPPGGEDGESWTGRQVLSTALPPIDVRIGEGVRIEAGRIAEGVLCAKAYSKQSRGLVHTAYSAFGPDAARVMLDNTQKIACDFLVLRGFSVGVSDLIVSEERAAAARDRLARAKEDARAIMDRIHARTFENSSTKTDAEYKEQEIRRVLDAGVAEAAKIAQTDLDAGNNRMLNMILSGSKGQPLNAQQMLACLGTQLIEQRRVPDGFDGRTLPHFCKYDDGPEARGFIENSFTSGLKPHEFFFHAMAGRIGLIDTAIRTASVGYLQRRLIKSMEDCKIAHDLTVRNANGYIIQFLYGEDGMDAISLHAHDIEYLNMTPGEMRDRYWGPGLDAHFAALLNDRRALITDLCGGRNAAVPVMYPVHFARIVESARAGEPVVDQARVLQAIDDLDRDLRVGRLSARADAVRWLPLLARVFFSPRVVIERRRVSREAFDAAVQRVREEFWAAVAAPGEMVGIVAAQSIGEPCTQLVLNTFHTAGADSASQVASGVPRMSELMSMSRSIKTPAMRVALRPEWTGGVEAVKDAIARIQTTRFGDIVRSSELYFDPVAAAPETTRVAADAKWLRQVADIERALGIQREAGTCSWVLRFTLDRARMLDLQIEMIDVEFAVKEHYGDDVDCYVTDDGAEELVCRARIVASGDDDEDLLADVKALEQSMLEALVIKGVPRISKAVPVKPVEGLKRFQKDEVFEDDKEWSASTSGSNLAEVLCCEVVDALRTTTNDVHEVFATLGVEAARAALIVELRAVLMDLPLDFRHLSLLVDTMCSRGFFMSIDRHGINGRGELGPLAKSSFEQTDVMLINAGVFAETDRVNGVSANVMLGQVAPCGTGECELLMDVRRMRDTLPPVLEEEEAAAAAAGADGVARGADLAALEIGPAGAAGAAAVADADELEIV